MTCEQFNLDNIDYTGYKIKFREEMLEYDDTKIRYKKLKSKLEIELIDNDIHKCMKCGNLVEKFPNDKTIFIGKDNEIVLIGEAPANNGWRKSHMLWRDVNGKVLPSGVV